MHRAPGVDCPRLNAVNCADPRIDGKDSDGERYQGHRKGGDERSEECENVQRGGIRHRTEENQAALQAATDREKIQADSGNTEDERRDPDDNYGDCRCIDGSEAAEILDNVETMGLNYDVCVDTVISCQFIKRSIYDR